MSSIVAIIDPASDSNAIITAVNSSANGALVFFNESNISLILTFADGSNMYLPAWYHRHKCGPTGSVNLEWSVHQVLSSDSPPISQLIVEAYIAGEKFPADGPLVRQANVGNAINTVGGGANFIQNDANASGTSIMEATVAGDPSSAVSLTNNAIMNLGSAAHPGQLTVTGGINANLVTAISGNDIGLKVAAGQRVRSDVDGAHIWQVDGSGVELLDGTLSFLVGSVSKIAAFGAYQVPNALTFFNHNLGVIPDLILLVPVIGITLGYVGYNDATMTTTQVQLISNSAANVYCRGLAIKF